MVIVKIIAIFNSSMIGLRRSPSIKPRQAKKRSVSCILWNKAMVRSPSEKKPRSDPSAIFTLSLKDNVSCP